MKRRRPDGCRAAFQSGIATVMTHVFHRHTSAHYPVAAKGDGVFIEDREGKRYLDASGGAAVSCLGHSNERVIAAVKAQLDAIPFAHTGFFTSETLDEPLLEQILAADLQIREDLEAAVEFLGEQHGAVTTAPRTSRSFFRILDEGVGRLERHLISRERILAAESAA